MTSTFIIIYLFIFWTKFGSSIILFLPHQRLSRVVIDTGCHSYPEGKRSGSSRTIPILRIDQICTFITTSTHNVITLVSLFSIYKYVFSTSHSISMVLVQKPYSDTRLYSAPFVTIKPNTWHYCEFDYWGNCSSTDCLTCSVVQRLH